MCGEPEIMSYKKVAPHRRHFFISMTAVGLEPTTNRLKVDCSTTELRGRVQTVVIR